LRVDHDRRFIYNVTIIRTNQLRVDVAVDRIRVPFLDDEEVEVFMSTKNTWLPGLIEGSTGGHATITGYKVRFAEKSVEAVPATHIRRRFLEEEDVHVYMSDDLGWTSAQVAPGITGESSAGLEFPPYLSDRSPGAPGSVEAVAREKLSESGVVEAVDQIEGDCDEEAPPEQQVEYVPHPWKMVPIRWKMVRGYRTEMIPSYHIRRRSQVPEVGSGAEDCGAPGDSDHVLSS